MDCMLKKTVVAFLLIGIAIQVFAQEKTSKAVIKGFLDKRFGMFIHWGLVSLRGTEIGWSRGD